MRTAHSATGVKLNRIESTQGKKMIRKVEAVVDEQGTVKLKEPVRLSAPRRAVVTIFDEDKAIEVDESALLSEPALAHDWNRPEEDAAWSYLQPGR